MWSPRIQLALATSVLVLSVASLYVVLQSGSDEPYWYFKESDAILQIGVAMILMLLWVQLAAGIGIGVVRRRISRWWILTFPWVIISEIGLSYSSRGYLGDIAHYVTQPQ